VTITHIAKIVVRILRMIERKVKDVLEKYQFGFWREKGSRDATGKPRIKSKWTLDIEEELCACFIDWQKACDCAKWIKLMHILKENGTDRSKRLIKKMHTDYSVKLWMDQAKTRSVKTQKHQHSFKTWMVTHYIPPTQNIHYTLELIT